MMFDDPELRGQVIKALHEHAAKELSAGDRYELRERPRLIAKRWPDERIFGIAWYHDARFSDMGDDEWNGEPRDDIVGCVRLGRYVVREST